MTLLSDLTLTAGARADRRRRRGRLSLVLLSAMAASTACGSADAGDDDDSRFLSGAGVQANVGDVLLRDISLDEPADGTYEPGDVARLRLVLFNEASAADALTSVSTPVAADVRLLVDRDCDGTAERTGTVPLPPQPPVARPAPTPPNGPEPYYRVDLLLDRDLRSGEFVPVTFSFANAGTTTVQVPIELAIEGDRDDDGQCEPAR